MRPHHSTTVCLAMGLWLLLAPPAFARTATWDGGGGDANASTAANWDTDTAPTNGDDVIFDGTSTKDCTWDIAPVLGLNTFSMNAGYTGTVTTDGIGRTLFSSGTTISSGTLTVSVNDTLDIATNNDPLTVNSGGTVTINGIFDASAGTATLTVNGSMTLSGLTNGNVVRPITIGSTGTLTLSMSAASTLSGTVTVNGALTATTDATLSGTVTVNSGGTLTVNSGGTPTVSGTLTANSGGTLAVNGTLTNSGTTFTLNAGATLNGTGTLSRTNATAPTLSGTIAMQSGSTFGTFRYAIGASATIPATTYTSHLALQGTGGANRTFTIGAGTLLTVAGNVTMDHSGGAALRLTVRDTINNTPITIGGNWDDDGSSGTATYTRGTEKVTFDGSGATGTITLDTTNITTSWNHVTFNESGTTFNVTGTSTVRGALTVGSGTTLDIDGDMTMTTAGSSIDNSGVIDETGGQILHPATSLKLTDANGIEVSGYAIKDQPVYVTLIDEDENVNGTRPDEANGVTVSIAGGDSETLSGPLILRETGDKTETFRNTTGLPTALLQAGQSGTANNGVLELLATDTISVAYTDAEDSTDSSAADTAATQTVGSSLMTIGQSVSSTRVSPGQPVVVTATLTNNQTTNSLTFRVEDTLPAGFVFQAGSATLDQVATTPTGAGQPLAFSNLTVSAGATRTLRYLLITGSAAPGQYVNTVVARINPIISNTSQVTLTVVPDPLFTLATVLGKVFVDANANGRQDRHEPGLADIRLATEEGVTVTTDTQGRFHLPDLLPGRHLLKLDRTTLPPGATLTTEHTRLLTATDGSLSKVNFGVQLRPATEAISNQPSAISQQPSVLRLGPAGPRSALTLSERSESNGSAISPPKELPVTDLSVTQLPAVAQPRLAVSVSPATVQLTREGRFAEPVTFTIQCNYPHFIAQWTLVVAQDEQRQVKSFAGTGPPPTTLTWDGALETGVLQPTLYLFRLFVWDQDGREDFTGLQSVEVVSEQGRR